MEGYVLTGDIHALLADISKGNMDAFGELYDSLVRRVLNYAYVITKNKHMAEDITHDVFLQTFKFASRIGSASNPAAYIMTITRNHSYNVMKRENKISSFDDSVPDSTTSPSPYEYFVFEEAFDTLPANQREAVYLHLICGYTHKDAAAIQNVPVVTIKWRYGQALSKLRKYFSQNETEVKCDERL